ncbi:MAG: hypothetical protein EAX86_01170 [Candidatus Heimdallarchaeota archaeon]|nr:hypothetical protein [Candidatus Heimdallarchaeota archaeon]
MPSQNLKTVKEYGLEFINEIAKDREVAQQEIGVAISGSKSRLTSQGTPHFTYRDLDDFIKYLRKETARIVDSELTRITIKSLGRIREIITGETRFIQEVVAPDENQMKQFEEELQKLRNQIKDKNSQISELEHAREENKKRLETSEDQIANLEMELKKSHQQLQNTHEQLELLQKQVEELSTELAGKDAVIESLKRDHKLQEKDVQDALNSVAETYKLQEDYYARMVEESVQSRMKQIRQEYDLELEEMRVRLQNEMDRSVKTEKQHKTTVNRLEESLIMSEDENLELKEKLQKVSQETFERNLLLDYTQRLLSSHPLYASILILLNLGGSLDLPTLAMSVGAHPRKLRQMLEDLVSRNLISITPDDPPVVIALMDK